ncbi:2-octaprenyl-3-methyl-6-methoxy-1,4-benzoquinol hydroxylase [Anaplasma centrale str. Israel]|uniref:2-octaprenyl-3-methyl-6-methoxy-1,4-benzoquinol hydroxylase n=1 Tax=Anaplasma centrale (strain Israel) TaxID=574556 RepID=D1ATD8_ANACI|nr:FAD-dependent monooxygenase [Anaplasma centrale]ACZ48816.1 2-octaprenyl-3-methyl-6-methoxy-1,4-benzoquinol hydroxylase [Anaplasma centrale str. Israel]
MVRYYDVVILGGGVNGILAGIGLTERGMKAAVVEQRDRVLSNLDHRVFAISKRSKDVFDRLGVWNCSGIYCPIEDILIFDDDSSSTVRYDHKLVGSDPMGYVISGKELSSMLQSKVNGFTHITSTSYGAIEAKDGFIETLLVNGEKISSRLVICAEGKGSKFLEKSHIKTMRYDYKQSCITCNVYHERHHRNIAIEHFFQGGPFAILPMYGGYHSSIIWTEKTEIAQMLLQLSDDEFETELQKKCGGHVEVSGRRSCHQISMVLADRQYAKRSLLVGDALHSIHPVAGQGLNIGIRDVEAVVEILSAYHSLGSDIGQQFILEEIEKRRLLDNHSMSVITTVINSIFSSNSIIPKVARRFAMSVVEMSPHIKKKLITHAMGMSAIC